MILKGIKRLPFIFTSPVNERDQVIRKNVIGSVFFQLLTNLIGLLIVPLCLSYIDKEKYGIWITATLLVSWLQNMNFGMGYGMQNKVAESIAKDDEKAARVYISITYQFSFYISLVILVGGLIAHNFINYNALFNSSIDANQLENLCVISFFCFLAYFIVGNLIPVLNAVKQTATPKKLAFFINALTIFLLLLVVNLSSDDLTWAALALALPAPVVYLFASLYYYSGPLKKFRPFIVRKSLSQSRFGHIFNLGSKFFLMQLTTLVVFQSGSFIITQFLGPAEVTPFNLISRYFYFIYFFYLLTLSPYWPAFTDAHFRKDYEWIRKTIFSLFRKGLLAVGVVLIMLYWSFTLIPIWSNHSFPIDEYRPLVFSSAAFIVILIFSTIISTFLNSINKLNTQLFTQLLMAVIAIPLALFFIKMAGMGSVGINVSIIICQILYVLICGRQMLLILKK